MEKASHDFVKISSPFKKIFTFIQMFRDYFTEVFSNPIKATYSETSRFNSRDSR